MGAFLAGWISLASVTQIFVAQNNGASISSFRAACMADDLARHFLSCHFCPLALWGPIFFFGYDEAFEMQRSYFFWMLLFGPFHGLFTALVVFS